MYCFIDGCLTAYYGEPPLILGPGWNQYLLQPLAHAAGAQHLLQHMLTRPCNDPHPYCKKHGITAGVALAPLMHDLATPTLEGQCS